MSDQIPQDTRAWTKNGQVIEALRVGDKCVVNWLTGADGQWILAGGVTPVILEVDDGFPLACITPEARQARVYYRKPSDGGDPDVRVILPDDAPFRASPKGKIKERSKSFDGDGNPVPQVRLLYALKTSQHGDRLTAMDYFPQEIQEICHGQTFGQTFGQIFDAMDEVARTPYDFRGFVGELIARSAVCEKGLADWALWEKVADDAAEFTRRRLKVASGQLQPNTHDRFIQAIKEATVTHRGLTAQKFVKERWLELGGIGGWEDIRKTLGFEWIPSQADWRKGWEGQHSGGASSPR